MKYIVTKNKEGKEEMFTFPNSINHDIMAEAVSHLKNQSHGSWFRVFRSVISAGFVSGGQCTGKSESLGLVSRPQDTDILIAQQNEQI